MKFLDLLNAALWAANAVTWAAYAHVTFMAVLCGLVTVTSLFIARSRE